MCRLSTLLAICALFLLTSCDSGQKKKPASQRTIGKMDNKASELCQEESKDCNPKKRNSDREKPIKVKEPSTEGEVKTQRQSQEYNNKKQTEDRPSSETCALKEQILSEDSDKCVPCADDEVFDKETNACSLNELPKPQLTKELCSMEGKIFDTVSETCLNCPADKLFDQQSLACLPTSKYCQDRMAELINDQCVHTATSCANENKVFIAESATCKACPADKIYNKNANSCDPTQAYCESLGADLFQNECLRCEEKMRLNAVSGLCEETEASCSINDLELIVEGDTKKCVETEDSCSRKGLELTIENELRTCAETQASCALKNGELKDGVCKITELSCKDPFDQELGTDADGKSYCKPNQDFCESRDMNFEGVACVKTKKYCELNGTENENTYITSSNECATLSQLTPGEVECSLNDLHYSSRHDRCLTISAQSCQEDFGQRLSDNGEKCVPYDQAYCMEVEAEYYDLNAAGDGCVINSEKLECHNDSAKKMYEGRCLDKSVIAAEETKKAIDDCENDPNLNDANKPFRFYNSNTGKCTSIDAFTIHNKNMWKDNIKIRYYWDIGKTGLPGLGMRDYVVPYGKSAKVPATAMFCVMTDINRSKPYKTHRYGKNWVYQTLESHAVWNSYYYVKHSNHVSGLKIENEPTTNWIFMPPEAIGWTNDINQWPANCDSVVHLVK